MSVEWAQDPVKIEENEGRDCLRKSGAWPNIWQRHPQYLDVDAKKDLPFRWNKK
jgi:hypothetical protein